MSQVITCPNCEKKLALKDELKGRTLICPQCRGRFTPPADEAPAPGGSGISFLDSLTPTPGATTAKAATKTPAVGTRPATTGASASPAVSAAARAAASREKKQKDQFLLMCIGGGVAVAIMVVVMIVVAMSPGGSGGGGGGGKKKFEKILFGMSDSDRHKLFNEMFLAVDQYGITKACKEEWFRLADEHKLDRKYLKDILNEGFDRKDWDQPAPAHITNQTRGARMEWIGKRAQGGDPILAL